MSSGRHYVTERLRWKFGPKFGLNMFKHNGPRRLVPTINKLTPWIALSTVRALKYTVQLCSTLQQSRICRRLISTPCCEQRTLILEALSVPEVSSCIFDKASIRLFCSGVSTIWWELQRRSQANILFYLLYKGGAIFYRIYRAFVHARLYSQDNARTCRWPPLALQKGTHSIT